MKFIFTKKFYIELCTHRFNLTLSLFAHYIGALPTYKKVWVDPKSESVAFWSLFFIARVLSMLIGISSPLTTNIFLIYFTTFDGGIMLLALRKGT